MPKPYRGDDEDEDDVNQLREIKRRYFELLYAVGEYYTDETTHQVAFRYIHESAKNHFQYQD
jgi:hypothetical protein